MISYILLQLTPGAFARIARYALNYDQAVYDVLATWAVTGMDVGQM